MLHVCGTRLPSNYTFHRQSQSSIIDPNEYLYVKVKYFVIYNNETQNVALENILAQHLVLNRDFDMQNSDVIRVPSSGNYNFANVVGKGKIRFLPIQAEEIQENSEYIERVKTSKRVFSGLDEVKNFLKSKNKQLDTGTLDIFICSLENNLLGEADMFSTSCVINYRTVGSVEIPGDALLVDYNQGRTTTHEVGHVLGLPHTFSQGGTCDSDEVTQEFDDIPVQKLPNFDAFIINNNGVYTGTLDNHFRDCNQPVYNIPGENPPYSCSDDCNNHYEMFINFMDYGNDINAIMFSKTQIQAMRNYLLGSNNLTLHNGPKIPPPLPEASLVPISTTIMPTVTPGKSSSSDLNGWVIAAIVFSSIIIIALIIVGAVYIRKTKG